MAFVKIENDHVYSAINTGCVGESISGHDPAIGIPQDTRRRIVHRHALE